MTSLQAKMADRGFDSDDSSDQGSKGTKAEQEVSCGSRITAALLQVVVYLKLNFSDIRVRKGTYCLGVASCLMVVVVTALMLTILGRLPILFMRLAEIDEGQVDLILTAGSEAAQAESLDYAKILGLSDFNVPGAERSFNTARIQFNKELSTAWQLGSCQGPAGQTVDTADPASFEFLWQPRSGNVTAAPTPSPEGGDDQVSTAPCNLPQGCPSDYCLPAQGFGVDLYAIDFEREATMGYGRDWSIPSPGIGRCVAHQNILDRLKLQVGDYLLVRVQAAPTVLQAFDDAGLQDFPDSPYTTVGSVMMPLLIENAVDTPLGKLPDDAGDFVFVDYATLLQHMAPHLGPTVGDDARARFGAVDPKTVAGEVIFNFPPKKRLEVYSQSDNLDVLASATLFATPIIATVGFNQVETDMPIVAYVQENAFFSLFLGLIISMLILGLGFLCIVLIHSLLSVGVQTRTFELGIMRMVGMTRPMLTGYVVTGALLFAIPGWAIGLALSQLLFLLIVSLMESALGVAIDRLLTPLAIGMATLVGILMPLLSSIAPIIELLSLDLPSALDTNRARNNAIVYEIGKIGAYHIDVRLVGIGVGMTTAGFLIYYLFPLALLTFNITLLFYIFFGILLGMLFGLVLLATSVQGLFETAIVYVLFFWEAAAVRQIVLKNLIAHRPRNRRTALMFSMSIGFLIFVSVTASIQIQSVIFSTERAFGGKLNIRSAFRNGVLSFTVMDLCISRLAELKEEEGGVPGLEWTWFSAALDEQNNVDNSTASNVGRYVTLNPIVRAVAPNYWDVALEKYLIVDSIRDSSWSLSESLYSVEGSARSVISTSYKKEIALESLDEPFVLTVQRVVGNESVSERRLVQSEAWLDSSPGFVFSQYTTVSNSLALSFPAIVARSQRQIPSIEMYVFEELIVNAPTEAEVDRVDNVLSDIIADRGYSGSVEVRNFYTSRDSLEVAVVAINAIFGFTQLLASIICYFALASSMTTNIHTQAKEIGILRSIGLRKFPCTRSYIIEAFALVFAACLIGIVVGVIMGYTIVLQRALFTQLPLPFVFPWIQLVIAFLFSIVLAFLSSWGPIRAMLSSRSITTILRRAL